MSEHKYILEPYKGISTRHQCPECGHKGEFAFYIDAETREHLHPSVGRCNRDQKCGYHRTPKQYFDEHPNIEATEWKPARQPKPQPKTDYLPIDILSDSSLESNNLFRFFCSKFGENKSLDVFRKYHVGTSKHWRNDEGLSTLFPQIDISGHLRQIKVIAYNPKTGHRLHKEHEAEQWNGQQYINSIAVDKVWFAGKVILKNYDANLSQCFFGEHLINEANKIAIVESEKTAMIASLYFPKLTWIATGGKNGCKWTNMSICNVLKGRTVYLYPDLKCLQNWKDKSEMMRLYAIDVHVSKWLEENASNDDKERGLDIADYLLSG